MVLDIFFFLILVDFLKLFINWIEKYEVFGFFGGVFFGGWVGVWGDGWWLGWVGIISDVLGM